MITFLKRMFAGFLSMLARVVVRKYHPKIVMITGSVGKTSTKDAIASALTPHLFIRAAEKSYNSEFGVPLTIFGAKNPWKSLSGWARVIKEALSLILLPNHYPRLLVLEVGADRPGDMARILRIATPDVVVVTRLPQIPVHVEAYATPEAVREEEFVPAYSLAPNAPLILASRDTHARLMAERIPVRAITYGFADDADVRIADVGFYEEEGRVMGMQAKIITAQGEGALVVKGSVGNQQVLPPAAAVAAAGSLGISLSDALLGLATYEPPAGRGRIFNGKNGSILIDDSYNASPAAVEEALSTLSNFPHAKRKIAVIGDMLELGRYSVAEHARIGKLACQAADIVISVGVRARGMKECTQSFNDSASATAALISLVEPGDVILIKGSQSIRTERIVEALLADPADCVKLVRQEKEWKRKS